MNETIPIKNEPVKKNWQYFVWNIFFSIMYPFLIVFALIITGVISLISHLFNALYYVVSFFRKKN